jgi:hypothetical protein
MKTFKIDEYIIFIGAKVAGKKFKVKVSELIKAKFQEPHDETNIRGILNFCLEYYAKEFETICQNETSYEFYKVMFWLHEQSVEMRRDKKTMNKLQDDIGQEYFFIYRRVLKLILEEACLINLVTEKINPTFKERTEKVFDDLMFLGDEIFTLTNLLAEEDMIGDVVAMQFTDEGLYELKRKHFFELAFEKIVEMNAYEPESFVTDKKAEADFIQAAKDSFNVNFTDIMAIIIEVFQHRKLEKWDILAIGISDIKTVMNKSDNIPEENTESFLSGLYFSRNEKIPIKTIVRKPYSINRFLNRPILIWNIEGKDYCIIGKYSMVEAIESLFYNAFPWNKAPTEWKANSSFQAFLFRKQQEQEKMLLDKVEAEIKLTNLIYQPTIKKLRTKTETIIINNDKCGEIDFLVINEATKKIFVVECKHLVGRYDMANFYLDFNSFTKGEDCFNNKIKKKVTWIKNNIGIVEGHFKLGNQLATSIKDFSVEGIFIINTPTFYMYYSDFRIYTFHVVADVLTGKHLDKEYYLVIDEEESIREAMIRYPYFKKKYFIHYHDPYEDYPVDKYGQPIIPEGE